ncbi:MAG: hypothetical protein IBJ18_10705 [Phycisphaerales bacterium]|nr:hypothetical protein [Phycisphaerales bacterium]
MHTTNPGQPADCQNTLPRSTSGEGAWRSRLPFTVSRAVLACAGVGLAALMTGCTEPQRLDGERYPMKVAQGKTVDVQVLRDETEITIANATANALPKGRLWLNAWYSRPFDGLAPGQSVTLDLNDFKDRFNDGFKAGGFFAIERPQALKQAQLMTESGELIGLVVIGQ